MPTSFTRRQFLARTAMAGAGTLLATSASAARTYQANERLRIGIIGAANRAQANIDGVAGEDIVALCDVDETYLAAAAKRFPRAATYADFRRLLDREKLDAVVISTTDHTHAPAAAGALRRGLHVYCEKPLTHTVDEARVLEGLARGHGAATQMGTQIHAESNYRRVVELVRADAIGPVREVHVWVGGGDSGGERPTDTPPVPITMNWDLWLGPAPVRPYSPVYAPHQWRGWWDFGSGTLGDMACHHMDLPYWALRLAQPLTVEAEGPPVHPESCPTWLIVRYEYPRREELPPVKLTWYNGGRRPPQFAEGLLPTWGNGTLFVGEKGMLLADYGRHVLLPEDRYRDFTAPQPTIPESIGHYAEWIRACKTGSPTTCGFGYSGVLTEAVLLGNVAYRTGQKLAWDPRDLRARGCPEADRYLRHAYRAGWEL